MHIAVDCFEGRIDDESDDTLTGDVGDIEGASKVSEGFCL
jgi:hypothetical protein